MSVLSKKRFDEILASISQLEPIMVLGDVGVDKYTLGEVKRISPEAPVPVIEVSKEWHKLGLASNVSDNLVGLSVKSTLCGVIGDDVKANLLEDLLEEAGLSTWGIVRTKEIVTTFKERVTTPVQQICRVDYETTKPISLDITEQMKRRIKELEPSHGSAIIEDYGKGLLSQSLCQYVIELFNNSQKLLTVDPSRNTPPLWYRGAGLLKPNLAESKVMVESLGYNDHGGNVQQIGQILIDKLALKKLVITLGPEGMAMIDTEMGDEMHFIPTVANEVFDVSGAGDTVISVLTCALMAGATLEEAAWIGNCAAGIVVSKKGTARVSPEELNTFHQRLRDNQ